MPQSYKKIEWVPKETLDEKTNTIYVDHRNLVQVEKETFVYSPAELSDIFSKALKNYDSDAFLKFKPNTAKRVHLFHNPLGGKPLQSVD